MLVVGIDPGLTNLGIALYDAQSDVFLRAETIKLLAYKGEKRGAWSTEQAVSSLITTLSIWWTDNVQSQGRPLHVDLLVVESQFKPLLCGLEGAVLALGQLWCTQAHAVSARSVKKSFGMRCTGSHKANKAQAVRKIRALGYGDHDHNAADAMLLCRLFYGGKAPGHGEVQDHV